MSERSYYAVLSDGIEVARVNGPEPLSLSEALNYARQYREEGSVRVYRVFPDSRERELVAAMSKLGRTA